MLEKQQCNERREKRSNRKILDQSSYCGPEMRIKHSVPYFHFSACISSKFTFTFSQLCTANKKKTLQSSEILPPDLKNINVIE